MLELNLKRNDFEFNRRHSLQVKGMAMGKRFTLARFTLYANIYMAN